MRGTAWKYPSPATRMYGLLLFLTIITTCLRAYGQEYPRWELFTGFSYAHVNLGPEVAVFQPTDQNYYGMHVNGSFNPRSYLRILLCDFSVQIGGTTVNVTPEHADVRTSQILFGPEFIRRSGKGAVFGHTLVGMTNARLVSQIGGSDIVPDVVNHTSLAFGFGGGFDFYMARMFSIRPIQADYIPTRISGTWEQHFRISSGITWTFGYTQSR
ncbi:MAG TPA: hypothetical protein VMS18_29495 [Candidatus Binatia bacterium]|nr:hypothetical protein [Candidatus Binatia bacterium]